MRQWLERLTSHTRIARLEAAVDEVERAVKVLEREVRDLRRERGTDGG